MQELIDRLRGALAEAGLERAVLSHPETLAHLCLFDPSVEEWPVANPFVASPALLVLDADVATLLVASFHAGHAARSPGARRAVPVVRLRAARPLRRRSWRRRCAAWPAAPGASASRPRRCRSESRDVLRAEGAELVEIDDARRRGTTYQAAGRDRRPSGGRRSSPTSSRARSRSSPSRASARPRSPRTRRPRWPRRPGGAYRRS